MNLIVALFLSEIKRCSCCLAVLDTYGVPLRSKYPDSEMLFQKQNISRDLQNMMRKLYFIDPDQKKFEFHFSIIRLPMEKKKFEVENSMTSRIEKRVECKKNNSKSRF